MKRVLILCTGNSCRSQMAQGLWQEIGAGKWQADSAGSKPSGYVHPLAIKAMADIGLDISNAKSSHLNEYIENSYDLVVTVCDNAKESCPVFPKQSQVLHWPFYDPAEATGEEEEKMKVFCEVRDQIKEKIRSYLDSEQPNKS